MKHEFIKFGVDEALMQRNDLAAAWSSYVPQQPLTKRELARLRPTMEAMNMHESQEQLKSLEREHMGMVRTVASHTKEATPYYIAPEIVNMVAEASKGGFAEPPALDATWFPPGLSFFWLGKSFTKDVPIPNHPTTSMRVELRAINLWLSDDRRYVGMALSHAMPSDLRPVPTDWFRYEVGKPFTPDKEYFYGKYDYESAQGDFSFIIALLAFMKQNIVKEATLSPSRHAKRQQERLKRPISDVHYVFLRPIKREKTAPGDKIEVEWSCQWIVRGHWRSQPYGPNHAFRKPVWVVPYLKGPENKPFRAKKETIVGVVR